MNQNKKTVNKVKSTSRLKTLPNQNVIPSADFEFIEKIFKSRKSAKSKSKGKASKNHESSDLKENMLSLKHAFDKNMKSGKENMRPSAFVKK